MLPLTTSHEEVLEEGRKKWREIIPLNSPAKWTPIPGMIVFQPDEFDYDKE